MVRMEKEAGSFMYVEEPGLCSLKDRYFYDLWHLNGEGSFFYLGLLNEFLNK
jgi:hypothetical protein